MLKTRTKKKGKELARLVQSLEVVPNSTSRTQNLLLKRDKGKGGGEYHQSKRKKLKM